MILLTILIITIILLILFIIACASVGGTACILMFSDVIVCIALLGLLVAYIIKKKIKSN